MRKILIFCLLAVQSAFGFQGELQGEIAVNGQKKAITYFIRGNDLTIKIKEAGYQLVLLFDRSATKTYAFYEGEGNDDKQYFELDPAMAKKVNQYIGFTALSEEIDLLEKSCKGYSVIMSTGSAELWMDESVSADLTGLSALAPDDPMLKLIDHFSLVGLPLKFAVNYTNGTASYSMNINTVVEKTLASEIFELPAGYSKFVPAEINPTH